MLSNDVRRLPEGGAQYSVLCREDGGVLDDLFTYRLADCEFLTVTNAANHEKDLALAAVARRGVRRRRDRPRRPTSRCSPSRARGRAALVGEPRRRRAAAADALLRAHASPARPMLVCGTGYTGEDGVELLLDPSDAPAVWDALVAGGAAPAGLGARDTLRLEVCFHLYGNDLSEDRGPDRGRARLVLQGADRASSAPRPSPRARGERPGREARAVRRSTVRGSRAQGNPVIGGGEVTSGTFSPCLERGIGMAYVPAERAEPGTRIEIDVRGTTRPAIVERKPLYRKGS